MCSLSYVKLALISVQFPWDNLVSTSQNKPTIIITSCQLCRQCQQAKNGISIRGCCILAPAEAEFLQCVAQTVEQGVSNPLGILGQIWTMGLLTGCIPDARPAAGRAVALLTTADSLAMRIKEPVAYPSTDDIPSGALHAGIQWWAPLLNPHHNFWPLWEPRKLYLWHLCTGAGGLVCMLAFLYSMGTSIPNAYCRAA